MTADPRLPAEWAFLTPWLLVLNQLHLPMQATEYVSVYEPFSLSVTMPSIRRVHWIGFLTTYHSDIICRAMLVVTRALRASAKLREALWPSYPHTAPAVAVEMLADLCHHVEPDPHTVRLRMYHDRLEDLKTVLVDQPSHSDSAFVDAAFQIALRQVDKLAIATPTPLILTVQPVGEDGLTRLADTLEKLTTCNPWVSSASAATSTGFIIQELRLDLPRIEHAMIAPLERIHALGISVTRLLLSCATPTPHFGQCLNVLLHPAHAGVAPLSHLEIAPYTVPAAIGLCLELQQLLRPVRGSTPVRLQLTFTQTVDARSLVPPVLPRMLACLGAVVEMLSVEFPNVREPIYDPRFIDRPNPPRKRGKRKSRSQDEDTANEAPSPVLPAVSDPSVLKSLRVVVESWHSPAILRDMFLAGHHELTVLDVHTLQGDPFTSDDIARLLREFPTLTALRLGVTKMCNMRVFLDAYEDPQCAHLRVLSLCTSDTGDVVEFVETLADPATTIANTLCELQLPFTLKDGGRLLEAVKRLLESANPSLWLLRLCVCNEHQFDDELPEILRPFNGAAIKRPRHKAALLSAVEDEQIARRVWAFATTHSCRCVCLTIGMGVEFVETARMERGEIEAARMALHLDEDKWMEILRANVADGTLYSF